MKLVNVIAVIEQLSDEDCIYAAPRWRASSPAIVAREPEDQSVPAVARGMTYLTSVRDAKRVIRARRRLPRSRSAEDDTRAVIYFAVHDVPEPERDADLSHSLQSA